MSIERYRREHSDQSHEAPAARNEDDWGLFSGRDHARVVVFARPAWERSSKQAASMDAMAKEVDGKFMGAFIRAVKPSARR